jgi:transcriptional regulator with XRE-family HTH domain
MHDAVRNDALIKARKDRGYTQEQVAAAARTDQSILSRIENGALVPKPMVALRLMRLLGLTFEQVMGARAQSAEAQPGEIPATGTEG